MAVRGRVLDAATQRRIVQLVVAVPIRRTARLVGVDRNTVRKYGRKKPGS